ncbi:MAG: GSCFA domain-containing protein [Muribaculaceae bacterium]|nr:GSCFA domain-containing protein [Muribaculaceae bacterium]
MKFRTEYEARPCANLLNPELPIVLIGSCFTDYIGERMRKCRWRAFPNICGTLYNPKSIANILRIACDRGSAFKTIEDSIAQRDQLWVSWLTDSTCTTYSRQDTEESVNKHLKSLRMHLAEAKALIVTFGTAWIYELSERPGYVVSNCHKFPADTFRRRRLSISEIVSDWKDLISLLSQTYPDLRIVFTVSPVRHLKDGFEGNSRSKAILQLACEEICQCSDLVDYFPAFEIVNDDLRDYRFYNADLVHPSPEAVEYIWQKFQDRYLSAESRALLKEGEKVTNRLNHRPIVYGSGDLAQYAASIERFKTDEYYNKFMSAHPDMLSIDE